MPPDLPAGVPLNVERDVHPMFLNPAWGQTLHAPFRENFNFHIGGVQPCIGDLPM